MVVPDTDHNDRQSAGARADAPAQSGLPGERCPRSKIKTVGAVVWFLMRGTAVPGAVVQPTERSEVQTACAWPLSCHARCSAQSCLLGNPLPAWWQSPRQVVAESGQGLFLPIPTLAHAHCVGLVHSHSSGVLLVVCKAAIQNSSLSTSWGCSLSLSGCHISLASSLHSLALSHSP